MLRKRRVVLLKTVSFRRPTRRRSQNVTNGHNYHKNGVDAFDFRELRRRRQIAHVPHDTLEAFGGQCVQFRVQLQQRLRYRYVRVLDHFQLFLPRPVVAALLFRIL